MVDTPDPAQQALAGENLRLKRAVAELTLLNDLARQIGAASDLQDILRMIIRRSLSAIGAEQGTITLVAPSPDKAMKTLVRTMVSSETHHPLHLDKQLQGWMHRHMEPMLINDPQGDDRFSHVDWNASIHSLLCVPLLVKSELRGVLTVFNKKETDGFTAEDQRLLAIIAAQSAQVVDNARLREEEQAYNRMQEELRVAAEIQTGLLPKNTPEIAGYSLAGVSIPAQAVGGDYFDFIPIDEHRLAFCLGDVSGKGLPAALLMANLQATIRTQTASGTSPLQCLARANTLLFRSTEPDRFATMFYGILDTREHRLCYCSAGHERPYLLSVDGQLRRLEVGGLILSLLEEATYEEATVIFQPGDALVVFSDGITDAENTREETYGEDRLSELLAQARSQSAAGLVDSIVAHVREYVGGHPQADDMTLVAIMRHTV